jgi:DNA-binding response OmpR family regulator
VKTILILGSTHSINVVSEILKTKYLVFKCDEIDDIEKIFSNNDIAAFIISEQYFNKKSQQTIFSFKNEYHFPVLAVLEASSVKDIRDTYNIGVTDIIRKPFIGEEILSRLDTCIKAYENTSASGFSETTSIILKNMPVPTVTFNINKDGFGNLIVNRAVLDLFRMDETLFNERFKTVFAPYIFYKDIDLTKASQFFNSSCIAERGDGSSVFLKLCTSTALLPDADNNTVTTVFYDNSIPQDYIDRLAASEAKSTMLVSSSNKIILFDYIVSGDTLIYSGSDNSDKKITNFSSDITVMHFFPDDSKAIISEIINNPDKQQIFTKNIRCTLSGETRWYKISAKYISDRFGTVFTIVGILETAGDDGNIRWETERYRLLNNISSLSYMDYDQTSDILSLHINSDTDKIFSSFHDNALGVPFIYGTDKKVFLEAFLKAYAGCAEEQNICVSFICGSGLKMKNLHFVSIPKSENYGKHILILISNISK